MTPSPSPFRLDGSDPTPIYAQLARSIRAAVAVGSLAEGSQLPTVRQLAVDLRVNANTIARVYADLERDGVVEARRGLGTFVRAAKHAVSGKRDRAREVRGLADRWLAEANALGISLDDVLHDLNERRVKEK